MSRVEVFDRDSGKQDRKKLLKFLKEKCKKDASCILYAADDFDDFLAPCKEIKFIKENDRHDLMLMCGKTEKPSSEEEIVRFLRKSELQVKDLIEALENYPEEVVYARTEDGRICFVVVDAANSENSTLKEKDFVIIGGTF